MKILIENTVPLNNGDAALIFSLGNQLKNKGHEVIYSTPQIIIAKQKYPNENWIETPLAKRFNKIPFLGMLYIYIKVILSRKIFGDVDVFISAPGGYVNSYYSNFDRKMQLMIAYKKIFRKKIFMYSQSIGPLNKKDEYLLKKYSKKFNLIYVRDDISYERMKKLDIISNVIQTKDAAFLLERIRSPKIESKKIAISVREWKHDSRNEKLYIDLISKIVTFFINKEYNITFLSTCQGIESYTDDSKMAKRIADKLPLNYQNSVYVDYAYYNLYELRTKLQEFDFVIGTRLHMCILSWVSGTPAFNISYEEKGRESYDYLKLPEFSVDYNFEQEVDSILQDFITRDFQSTFQKIDEIHLESLVHLDRIL